MTKTANPQTIGKYTLVTELGRGPASIVYYAHDPFADRDVAIKLLDHAVFVNEAALKNAKQQFLAEASIAGKLNHPHIVSVYDAQAHNNQAYIVMELINGASLEDYAVPERLLPVEKVMQLIYKCATALDFACNEGVIHRDIKLTNIILSLDNEIKITDFGAAVLQNSVEIPQANAGTPAYMSPEQALDSVLSHQTDIYSLGVVMFKLLTGRFPHEADSVEQLKQKILHGEPLKIRALRPEIPEAIAKVVHSAIEKDTSMRYLHWADFVRDLAASEQSIGAKDKQVSDSEKINTLKSLEFFDGFSDVELWEVLSISQWGKFSAGKTLVKEGEFGNSFFLLAKGQVNVLKNDTKLTAISKGGCFGEMAYIDKENALRTASIFSISPVTLVKINSIALEKASSNLQLRFNRAFLKILVRRLADANAELVGDFIATDVD